MRDFDNGRSSERKSHDCSNGIEERGWTPDTLTPKTPSPISATGAHPLLVEANRCEAKAPPKKFNTQARMSVGGKGLQWCNEKLAQAQRVIVVISSDEDKGEKRQDKKPPAPRHSLRLLGVKRKNYVEHTLEPKEKLRRAQRLGELHEP